MSNDCHEIKNHLRENLSLRSIELTIGHKISSTNRRTRTKDSRVLSPSVYKLDALDIVDPRSMRGTCHI